MSERSTDTLQHLPPELLLNIAELLPRPSLCALRATSIRLEDVTLEVKTYFSRFEALRIRMYERRAGQQGERHTVSISNSLDAARQVLSALHPKLRRRLREVTFLLGPCVSDNFVGQVQQNLRKVFTILGSTLAADFKLRLSRGGSHQGFERTPVLQGAYSHLPRMVFRELLHTSQSGHVRYIDLLLNLESTFDARYVQRCHSLLVSTMADRGLLCLKRLHFNIPNLPRREGFSYKEEFMTSYRTICRYADMVSRLAQLEELDLSWGERGQGVAADVEGYTINRILQQSTLPSLRSLRLSGKLRDPCFGTADTLLRFLQSCPRLENLTLASIALRGLWDGIFDWIATHSPQIRSFTLADLSFWVGPGGRSGIASVHKVSFLRGDKAVWRVHVTGDHREPLRYRRESVDADIDGPAFCCAVIAEYVTSWKEEDLATLLEASLRQSLSHGAREKSGSLEGLLMVGS